MYCTQPLNAADLQFASLGDFKLQSGAVIHECRIGYRTFGTLNASELNAGTLNASTSNAILFSTWFTGTSEQLSGLFGPGKLVDSSKYFVIAVDSLGNGVSSAPSNSKAQPRMKFPQFTIRDMVESQHRLLNEKLGIHHLHAVMGISMGGMQTFQWMVSYPDFMDLAIPIVGSPQLNAADLLLWNAELHAIESSKDWNQGEYAQRPQGAMNTVSDIHAYALTTPEFHALKESRENFESTLRDREKKTAASFDTNDWLRQLQAMINHDIGQPYGGLPQAASRVKAKVLVVVSAQDHMVNPWPAKDFAKLLGADVVELTGNCGHLANGCESAKLFPAVASFLAK